MANGPNGRRTEVSTDIIWRRTLTDIIWRLTVQISDSRYETPNTEKISVDSSIIHATKTKRYGGGTRYGVAK